MPVLRSLPLDVETASGDAETVSSSRRLKAERRPSATLGSPPPSDGCTTSARIPPARRRVRLLPSDLGISRDRTAWLQRSARASRRRGGGRHAGNDRAPRLPAPRRAEHRL